MSLWSRSSHDTGYDASRQQYRKPSGRGGESGEFTVRNPNSKPQSALQQKRISQIDIGRTRLEVDLSAQPATCFKWKHPAHGSKHSSGFSSDVPDLTIPEITAFNPQVLGSSPSGVTYKTNIFNRASPVRLFMRIAYLATKSVFIGKHIGSLFFEPDRISVTL